MGRWPVWAVRLAIAVAMAAVAVAAAWPLYAEGKPWLPVLIGGAAALVGALAPLLVERLLTVLRRHKDLAERAAGWQAADPDQSVAWLLHPSSEVVPFTGRTETLQRLHCWCDSDRESAVRLIAAGGGVGKTRLARHFADTLERGGWQVWRLADGDEVLRDADAAVGDEHAGKRLLVLVDYAEARALGSLAGLIGQAVRADRLPGRRVRLLLLARHAGLWWQHLADYADKDAAMIKSVTDRAHVVIDLPVRADTRPLAVVLSVAAEAFADRLNLPLPAVLPEPEDSVDSPLLRLHAQALVAVLGTKVLPGKDVLGEVLHHEERFWLRRARRANPPLVGEFDPEQRDQALAPLRQLAAVAALLGTQDGDQVASLVTRAPGMAELDADQTRRWAGWLADLYPAADDRLGTVQPDLLAEYLAAELVTGCDETAIKRLFATLSEGQAVRALTVIGRACPHHPALKPMIARILFADLAVMAPAAVRVAVQFPGTYSEILNPLLPGTLNLHQLQDLTTRIPYPSLELCQVAVTLTSAITALQPADTAGRAHWANQHALRLAEIGQHAAALQATEESIVVVRQLAEADPDKFLPDLAGLLNNVGATLTDVGRHQEALNATEEAVSAYRRLAAASAQKFLPELAASLSNLGSRLSRVGRYTEALSAAEEAVSIYGRVVKASPGEYMPDLAMALSNLSNRLLRVGLNERAVAVAEAAVKIRRQLAEANADAYLPDLSMSLNNLGVMLSEVDRHEEALTVSEEAVAAYRQLAGAIPGAFLPDLAGALANLGKRLWHQAGQAEALAATEEAIDYYRALALSNDSYLPSLASSLHNLGAYSWEVKRQEHALLATEEAATIRRGLAETNPRDFLPDLADSLTNLGIMLSTMERREEALTNMEERVTICRLLADADPAAHLPSLAMLLGQAAWARHELGTNPEQALQMADEAVRLYQSLTDAEPETVAERLPMALDLKAAVLETLGRHAEAQEIHQILETYNLDMVDDGQH